MGVLRRRDEPSLPVPATDFAVRTPQVFHEAAAQIKMHRRSAVNFAAQQTEFEKTG
jgi:hypothetical protein